ncbi:MAG: OmpA family protein [Muribaculaceae bacterium]|nr:OmpA family protein [Muribaculaceae bacterium]
MKQFLLNIALALTMALTAMAGSKVDIYDLSLDQNLDVPAVPDKHAERVTDFQYQMAVKLAKQGFETELMRDGEVIVVTIQAATLFAPNDTVLSTVGKNALKPLLDLLKPAGFYKLMLVMHADNTGSPRYAKRLTSARVNAVYDWMDEKGSVDFVVPYAMGNEDPIDDNGSMEGRRHNRRLEVYIIPEEGMLNKAKKGKIKK